MHHTCSFMENITAPVTDSDVNALQTGEIFPVQNNHFYPNEDYDLVYALALSTATDRGRIVTPRIRGVAQLQVWPINVGATMNSPQRPADYRRHPFRLRSFEEVSYEVTLSGVAAQDVYCVLGLMRQFVPVPAGDIFCLRGSSTTAATADAWSTIAVTWEQNVPQGRFPIVGLSHRSTNGVACRLNVPGQWERPGCLSVAALGDIPHEMFTTGGLGIWAYFQNTAMPVVEVLANAADAVHELRLYFVVPRG